MTSTLLQKSNFTFVSKEATNRDISLKMQLWKNLSLIINFRLCRWWKLLLATCLIVICSYLFLAELYTFRFVNKDCFLAVHSYKPFKKYLNFTNKLCEYRVWNHCVRESISSLYYSSLKLNIKSPGIAFCSYLSYELFQMLDQLSLMSIFHYFAFCTRTCNINGICRFQFSLKNVDKCLGALRCL